MTSQTHRLRLGTRGSELALRQARMVQDALLTCAHMATEVVVVRTAGDDLAAGPGWRDDTPGLFTTELEQALDGGAVDVAVHSLKDLPTEVWSGTVIGAVLERAHPGDAIVSAGRRPLRELRPGARIGTSSLRRRAQLLALRPDLDVVDLRGNVPTRLARVAADDLDAIVLAVAGLERLGRGGAIAEILPVDQFVPAPGQGAIAVQARAHDASVLGPLRAIAHEPTERDTRAERACLAAIEGGCQAPVGVYARTDAAGMMTIDAFVSDLQGTRVVRAHEQAAARSADEAIAFGRRVAERLLSEGAGGLWHS